MERESNNCVNLFFIHVKLKATQEKLKNLENNVKIRDVEAVIF